MEHDQEKIKKNTSQPTQQHHTFKLKRRKNRRIGLHSEGQVHPPTLKNANLVPQRFFRSNSSLDQCDTP